MLGQGEFAARLAEAIDDLDGDVDVGGTHVFLALGQVTIDDGSKSSNFHSQRVSQTSPK